MSHPRFSIIPAGAVTDRSLEPRDLQVLCLLGRHTDKVGWCVRSQVKMAQEIDCGRSSVQRSLERLYEAGWVEKKRRDTVVEANDGRPSASHAYRVRLDRDDFALETITKDSESDNEESYAETALEGDVCPPVGTHPDTANTSEDIQPVGHPGAQPYVGTGAQPYVGTKNVPFERPLIERERDARARDRKARFLVSFEARWPTAAADNRQRTAYAADALTEPEEESSLAGIAPFLENQKRLGRKNVPAGWRYLEEKRWTLLEQKPPISAVRATNYAKDTVEAKAITALYEIARAGEALRKIWRRADGSIDFRPEMTPQFRAMALVPDQNDWVMLDFKQAGAWESLLKTAFVPEMNRHHPREGDRAPWPWPPSVEGKIYTTGPPDTLMSEQDMVDFQS